MYKQSHNNNDIEFMIFVLLIEGRIFCIIFGIFFSCIIYNFHKELPKGTSGHSAYVPTRNQ